MKQFRFLLLSIFCVTLQAAELNIDPNDIPSEDEINTAFKEHGKVLLFFLNVQKQTFSEQFAQLQQLNEALKENADPVLKAEGDLLKQRLEKKTDEHLNVLIGLPITFIGGILVGDKVKADFAKGSESSIIKVLSDPINTVIVRLLEKYGGLNQYSIQHSKFGFTIEITNTNLLQSVLKIIEEYTLDTLTATKKNPSNYLYSFAADQIKHMLHLTESNQALSLPNGYIILHDSQGAAAAMAGITALLPKDDISLIKFINLHNLNYSNDNFVDITKLVNKYLKDYPNLATFTDHFATILEGELLYNLTSQSLNQIAQQTKSNKTKEFIENFFPSNGKPAGNNQLITQALFSPVPSGLNEQLIAKGLFQIAPPELKLKVAISSFITANRLLKNEYTIPGTDFGDAQYANICTEAAMRIAEKYYSKKKLPSSLNALSNDAYRELGQATAEEVGYYVAAKGIHWLAQRLGINEETAETVVPKNCLPNTVSQLVAANLIKFGTATVVPIAGAAVQALLNQHLAPGLVI